MSSFICILEGKPLRKRAHKTTLRGNYIDPDRAIKEQLSDFIKENYILPASPLVGCLKISVRSFFNIPKSVSKVEKKRRLKQGWADDIRTDNDNICKLYADILNYGCLKNLIFKDDHNFVWNDLRKYWTDDNEKVVIKIETITDNAILEELEI